MSGGGGSKNQMVLDLAKKVRAMGAQELYIKQGSWPFCLVKGELLKLQEYRVERDDIEAFISQTASPLDKELYAQRGWVRYSPSLTAETAFLVDIIKEKGSPGISLRFLPENIPELSSFLGQASGKVTDVFLENQGFFIVCGRPSSGKTTFLASLLEDLNQRKSLRVVHMAEVIGFNQRCENAFIRQIEMKGSSDILAGVAGGTWDVVAIDMRPDARVLDFALQAAETGAKVAMTLTAGSTVHALEALTWLFPDESRPQMRERLSRMLKGAIYLSPLWSPRGEMVFASEFLVVTPTVRNLLKDGKFKEIADTITSGQKYGMYTLEMSIENLREAGLISR